MEMMRDLARHRGRAVVMVTHDNRVLEYADRIVRIEDGKILERESDETKSYVRDRIFSGTGERVLCHA
jgi:putative ABC transport system ATP-binding protein